MVVAIVTAIRIRWKDAGNQKDAYYFWNNAHSNIWYSSEVVGTIIVQCIPVLRPLLRDIHTTLTSRRLDSTARHSQQVCPSTMLRSNNHANDDFQSACNLPDHWQ